MQRQNSQQFAMGNTQTSYFNRQIDAFYQHLYKELVLYLSDTPPSKPCGEGYRNFLEYWTYTLFRDYGIKRKIHKYGETKEEEFINDLDRRIFGDNKKLLVQFYYNKGNRAYDKNAMITQLCRHMLFDFSSFSIVSLGVTKSLSGLDELWESIPSISKEGKKEFEIEEFREGTMLIYNPSLEQFNYEIVQRDVDEEEEQSERQIRHFETSTRRKIGTSYFNNPGMSFKEMFDDNDKTAGFEWEKLPQEFKNSFCFVFNVEHKENRIVSPFINNVNTLVAAYRLVDIKTVREKLNKAITDESIKDESVFKYVIRAGGYISEYKPSLFNSIMKNDFNLDLQFNVPKTINNVFTTLEELKVNTAELVSKLRKYDVGIVVRDRFSGVRTKLRNSVYTELLELKGHHPMSLNENNNVHLFRLWWRLKKDKQIKKFLSVFETKDNEYEKLFRSYHDKMVAMTHNLFDTYQAVFVRKEMPANEIEYKFKPMCGDLHKAYMQEKRGRIKKDVIEYINSCEWYKIYWRLFGLSVDIEFKEGSTEEVKLPDTA
jgi:hypothetical protein